MEVDDSIRLDVKNSRLPKMVRNRNIKVFLTALMVALCGIVIFIISLSPGISWFGVVVSLLLLVIAFYGFYLAYSRTVDIFNYPALKRFVAGKDADSTIRHFIEEMNAPAFEFNFGILTRGRITENFIILESFYRFSSIHFTEIVWVYKKETRTSVNMIPTGTTHGAMIHLSNGQAIQLNFNQNDMPFISLTGRREAEDFLSAIHELAPFAAYGYSYELSKLWNRNRKEFISKVQERMLKMYS